MKRHRIGATRVLAEIGSKPLQTLLDYSTHFWTHKRPDAAVLTHGPNRTPACVARGSCPRLNSRNGGTSMKSLATAVVALSLTLSSTVSHAAELRVLAGGAMTAVWAEIKPKFEQASGHKLDIFY